LSSSASKPLRSRSFNRGSEASVSRTPSRQQDSPNGKELVTPPGRSRVSSDVSSPPVSMRLGGGGSASRTSFDKSRAMKMFMAKSNERDKPNGRSESRIGHRKTDSMVSMEAKQGAATSSDTEKTSFEVRLHPYSITQDLSVYIECRFRQSGAFWWNHESIFDSRQVEDYGGVLPSTILPVQSVHFQK
jgi:hypothetical protein